MLEKDAGFITPERAIIAFTKLAQNNGAKINTNKSKLPVNIFGSNFLRRLLI